MFKHNIYWTSIYLGCSIIIVVIYIFICLYLFCCCRITILPSEDKFIPMFERLKTFHQDFMMQYMDWQNLTILPHHRLTNHRIDWDSLCEITDKHFSLDAEEVVETSVISNSPFQDNPHPHRRTHQTNYRYSWVQTIHHTTSCCDCKYNCTLFV